MRRLDPDVGAGIVGTLICVAVGVPVAVVHASGGRFTLGPPWLWWLAFAGFVAAQIVSTWLEAGLTRRVVVSVFGAQVVLGAAVVLLAPRAGWTPILLVYTTAFSAYVVTWRVTAAIAVGNTAVAGAAAYVHSGSWAEALLTALLYLLLQLGSVLGVTAQRRETAMRRQLSEAHVELRAASALLARSSRADERLRIARELHDLIGHQLTALTLELEVAAHHSTPPASEHVTRAGRVARELLGDVRATVGELRRRAPDLRETLEQIVADLPRPAVHLRIGDRVRVDEERTTALVRCVQEVLTNTIRHSEARHLWIEIDVDEDGGTTLSARDDGWTTGSVVPGNGLRGISERFEQLGGRASFAMDQGFRVAARVPAP